MVTVLHLDPFRLRVSVAPFVSYYTVRIMTRKEIRLTQTSYAVLALFEQVGEATSYDLKQAIEISIENFWPLPHTTAYDEPARLAEAGYLTVRQESGGRRRKLYALTDAGRDALHAWAAEPVAAPPQLRDEALLKVFAGADPTPLMEARRRWNETKVAELEVLLKAVRTGVLRQQTGPERTLVGGIAYHRKMLEVIDALLTVHED
jgi:PadR family transcriptional regulator, regulatory protein AphA